MPDPRKHRHVTSVDGDRLTYVCHCVNEITRPWGVLRSVSKCPEHTAEQKEVGELGFDYYATMGTVEGGVPMCARYIGQLEEAIGAFPPAPQRPAKAKALEIGCGMSMYVPALLAAGYDYLGVDPSPWACEWTRSTFNVKTHASTIETMGLLTDEYDLILAAHCLEHLGDSPRAIRGCYELLRESGSLFIVVPDDEDPLNPDHRWFWSTWSLRQCLEATGFSVVKIATRKYIERESFIYCHAVKL